MKNIITLFITLLAFSGLFAQDGGSALSFPASNSGYIRTFASNVNFQYGFSAEMWIKTGSTLSTSNLVSVDIGGSTYFLSFLSNGSLYGGKSGSGAATSNPAILAPNKQYHIAITVTSGNLSIVYVNGERVASKLGSGTMATSLSSSIDVGKADDITIDQLRIWASDISEGSLHKWMHREVTSAHYYFSDLVCSFDFNEGNGSTVNSFLGSVSTGTIVGNSSWVSSGFPTVGNANDFKSYKTISAVWDSNDEALNGALTLRRQNPVLPGNWFILASSKDYSLVTNGLCNDFNSRINSSWRIVKKGSISIKRLEADLSLISGLGEVDEVGLLYSYSEGNYGGSSLCAMEMELLSGNNIYQTARPFSTQFYAGNYICLGFKRPEPVIKACNDPRGGIQIEVNHDLACEGEDKTYFTTANEVGFHAGGTADVNVVWGTSVTWNQAGAVTATRNSDKTFVAYIPNVDAYFGVTGVSRINCVFNQGLDFPLNPWASELKRTNANGDCIDFAIMMSDITETCTSTTSIDSEMKNRLNLQVAPNPFSQQAKITFANPQHESFQAKLTHINGQVVRSYQPFHGEEMTIERGNLTPGMYLLTLISSDGQHTSEKLILR